MADEITRNEVYLSAIAEGSSDVPEPITREEQYLAKIAGADVGIPEKAITRKEQYYKKIVDNGGGGGSATLIEKSISANGVYNASDDSADGYSKATVNVPNSYAAGDEGKVVSDGALVSQSSVTYDSNGTYDTTLKNSVTVNVQPPVEPALKDINFYDYDGTRLYSYTKSEWANVTELPPNPSHSGLLAQGWNYAKTDIDTIVSGKMRVPLDVGATYKTQSGATEIDIELFEPYLSPRITTAPNGTIVIDWGDGSTDTVTGTNSTTNTGMKHTNHTYASAGNYTIKISITSGKYALFGYTYNNCYFLMGPGGSAYGNLDKTYQSTVKRIRLGDGDITVYGPIFANMSNLESVIIPPSEHLSFANNYNFVNCVSLKAVIVPKTVAANGNNQFNNCYSLKVISFPKSGVWKNEYYGCYSLRYFERPEGLNTSSSIGESAFYECWSLQTAVFPSDITAVNANAFYNCRSLRNVYIRAGSVDEEQNVTIPTLANTNAFSNNASGRKIYVPRSENQVILNAYKNASNWSTYASAIEEEPQ